MSVFFNPKSVNTQPRFTAGSRSAEYQEGLLLGYLHNILHYPTVEDIVYAPDCCFFTVSALSSTVAPGISPDFDRPHLCTGIKNIVDLHAKTLWLGHGRITDKTRSLFDELEKAGMTFRYPSTDHTSISCAQYVEELVINWGFSVVKIPERSTVYIYPIFRKSDISSIIPIDHRYGFDADVDDFYSSADSNADDIWNMRVSDKLSDIDPEQISDFKQGFFDGFSY